MDSRLRLMKDLSRNRDSIYERKLQSRFGRLQDRLKKRQDDRVDSIRHNLERDLRKLYRKQCSKRQLHKFDIIKQHSEPKFDLYTPQMHFGKHPRERYETLQKQFLNKSYIEREYTNEA